MAATAPDYDLRSPAARDMYSRAGWTFAFALVVYINSRTEYPGPALNVLIVLTLIALLFLAAARGLTWINVTGSDRVRSQLLDALNLQGTERILDAGCGRGALGIAAAKRLKSGRVIGIGQENDVAKENAKLEGVADKIRFEPADLPKLPYPDANFDVVISSRALHQIEHAGDRAKLLREMARVLKPAGRLAIHEIGDTAEYTAALTAAGMQDVTVTPTSLPMGLGGRIVTARR